VTEKARFEGDDPVIVTGQRRGDVLLAVISGALLALIVFAAVVGSSDMDAPTLVLTGGMLAFLTWALTGTLWRLRKGGPVFQADGEGFRVHRSISPDKVRWTDVRSVAIDNGAWRRPATVRFRLKRRLRSFNHPIGTRELHLALPYMGLSRRNAADLLRQLRRLRGATVTADRRLRSPDPDAAG